MNSIGGPARTPGGADATRHVLGRWLSRIALGRVEASVPLALGLHGLTVPLLVPVPGPVVALFVGVAALGLLGLLGWRSRRAVLTRAGACLLVAVTVQTLEPQMVPSMLQWYYCLVAVYAVLLTGWAAALTGPAAAACYLLQEALSTQPLPIQASGLRAAVLTSLGLVMYVAGRSYRQERDRAERRRHVAEQAGAALEHAATHDPLTGLPNRAYLLRRLAECPGGGMSVVVLDVDRFSTVNDALGYAAGDEVLVAIAERLVRGQEAGQLVARLGADKFAILCPTQDRRELDATAAGLLSDIRAPLAAGQRRHELTATAGLATAGSALQEPADLLRAAEVALHAAKTHGANQVAWHEPTMTERAGTRLDLEQQLRRAVRDPDVGLVYQPIVDLETGRIRGVEALARWAPGGRVIGPDVFIPLAEEIGLIDDLGHSLLHQALAAMRRIVAAGVGIETISVNVSPLQMRDAQLPRRVGDLLATHDLPASRLTLELTESAVMTTDVAVLDTIHRLRGLGVRLSLDDFGTGYSSLSHLRRLPVSEVKIDRSFVAELGADDTVARLVLALARGLGLHAVAEGVETPEQVHRLRALGCDAAQGYHLGRPMSERQLLAAAGSHPTDRRTEDQYLTLDVRRR